MSPARERLRPRLEGTRFEDGSLPVVTNVDARPETSGAARRDALVRQVDSPVRWVESVQRLFRDGVDRALEIGPGNVLAGLVRRIEKGIKVEGYA
jgi:[acyl-carrier-protein] S-malonyltransferase